MGKYEVTVEAPGFKKFVVKAVAVDIGHVAAVNATLQVGGATETVTVESSRRCRWRRPARSLAG